MMKSFFKKLAVVMALAMVVSMAAPAGSALAASKGISLQGSKEIITTYELDKVGATVDFAFQGAPSDWKTTTKWTSSNEKIATVDKDGIVKAVAAGTATITITSGATGSYKHSVVVTVKGATTPVVTPAAKGAFTVKQTSVDTAILTFDVPATGVTVDTLEVIWLISDLEVEMNKKNVIVENNVATVVMNDDFVDGGEYIFRYDNKDVKYTASVGAVHRVGFTWYTDDETEGAGQAYVNTDEEPAVTVLVPHVYDANGVDVTDKYDMESDFEVTYSLATESDSYDINQNEITFNAISQAVVNMAVTWQDEEGEDHTLYGVDAIVAVKRPAVKFTFVKGGFLHEQSGVTDNDDGVKIVEDFTTNVNSTAWKKAMTTWVIGDEYVEIDDPDSDDPEDKIPHTLELQVAAILKDNRGNTVVTGMEQGEEDDEYQYGSFMFGSSKESVMGATDEGVITFYEPGRASVLVYFVPVDAEDPEEEKVLVGAVKVTAKAERYASTYKMIVDSTSQPVAPKASEEKDEKGNKIYEANDNLDKDATVVLQVYDQYGAPIFLEDDGAIVIKAASNTNEVEPHTVKACGGCGSYGYHKHYHIVTAVDEFAPQVKSASSKSFKYNVSIDPDVAEKITGKADSYSIKAINVNTYYSKLDKYFADVKADKYDPTAKDAFQTFYIGGVANKTVSVDLAMKNINEWDNLWATDNPKYNTIYLNYLNANNGYALEAVPEANIQDIEVDKDGKLQTTGLAGVVYFKDMTSSSKLKGKMDVSVADGQITVRWPNTTENYESKNIPEASGDYFKFAEAGTYKLNLWTTGKNGAKLSAKTYTYSVKNSTAPVVYAGYNPETGNEAESVEDVLELIRENLVFKLDGKVLDLKEGNVAKIVDYKLGAVKENSVTILNVTFAVRVDDGRKDLTDTEDYYLVKEVRVGKTIVAK